MASCTSKWTIILLFSLVIQIILGQNIPLTLGTSSAVTFVAENDYIYFTLPQLSQPLQANQYLTFVLTPLSAGDVDIYISQTTTTPTARDYKFKSVGLNGLDQVVINTTDYVHQPFYVGVHGYRYDATFTLTAYLNDGHITIIDGIPQISSVMKEQYMYFKYWVTTSGAFIISNTAILGNSDIYVSTTTEKPTSQNYEYKMELDGSDVLSITHSSTEGKWYYIGIYGKTLSSFSLATSHTETKTQLADGIPLREVLSGYQTAYFKYNLTALSPLTITVTKRSYWGDPDVYISTSTDTPGPSSYMWRANAYGSDSVTIQPNSAGFKLGYFYIAVRDDSSFQVTFDIVVRTQQSHIVLTAGRPQNMESEQGKFDYYKFYYNAILIDGALDFVATASNGRVQIAASRTNQFPDLSTGEYKGQTVGSSSSIHIKPVPSGWYYIAVYSSEPSNYTITAASTDDPIYLMNGRPMSLSVERQHFKPFIFDVNDTSLDVTFSLLTQSGDADLYVGIKERTYIWWSISGTGADNINIPAHDPSRYSPDFHGRFYIYVHGYFNSFFTITAHLGNTTVELLNGIPVAGHVATGEYSYYRYYMTQAGRLSFNLQIPDRGYANDADFYVARSTSHPTKDQYDYNATHFGSDYISIDATPGFYWIAVYGVSSPNASYILSVTADYESLLANGLSIVDSVPKGTYRFYTTSIPLNTNVTSVTTGVTLISGATKLYMLNNGSFPSSSSFTKRDESWPGNLITVPSTDRAFTTNSTTWTYAVYGEDESTYLIHSSFVTAQTVIPYQGILRAGEPKIGQASTSSVAYFRFNQATDTNKNYYLNVGLLTYTPDSIVGVYIDQEPRMPNETSYTWSMSSNYDMLAPIDKSKFSGNGALVVGVKLLFGSTPWTQTARFILTLASEDEPVFLTQEQPHEVRAVAGKSYAFEVFAPRDATNLNVYVRSCTNSAPPKFYISKSIPKPNSTYHEAESIPEGKYSQVYMQTGIKPNQIYYIGTDAIAQDTSFTIYAFTKNDLRPKPGNSGNLQVIGTVAVGRVQVAIPAVEFAHYPVQYLAYKRTLQAGETIDNVNMETICAITKSSQLVARADVPPNRPPVVYANVPVSYDEKAIVNIIAEDVYRLKGLYKPLFFTTDPQNVLRRGYPMRAYVNASEYVNFIMPRFDDAPDISVQITLTPFSGDVDIYVSNKFTPTKDHYIWKGEKGGADVITITKRDGNFSTGPYAIAVYGVTNAEFTVTAFVSPIDNITLFDGQPQIASISRNSYAYFAFYLDDNSTFSISATPVYGDPDVYVSTTNTRPSRSSYEWSASLAGLDVLSINNTHVSFKPQTTYYIAVYGWLNSMISLTATKHFSIGILNEGLPQGGFLKQNQFAYYKFELLEQRGLVISVTPLAVDGDPDLFISTQWQRPTPYRFEWSSISSGSDSIVISPTDPHYKKGTFYIAVRAYRTDCLYQLTVVTSGGSSLTAIDGVPQNVFSQQNQWTYFQYYHGFQENRFSITASPLSQSSGVIEMFMSRTVVQPSDQKYDTKYSRQGAISFINVPSGAPVGWYYVGVRPISNAMNYTFTVSSNQAPSLLIDGQLKIQNYVPSGYTKYFVFMISPALLSTDIVIATSVEFGDPDLYVSWNSTRPGPQEYNWKSDRAGGDSLTIHGSEIPSYVRRLNIGLFAYTAARFSIVAFSANQTQVLQDATGTPGNVLFMKYNHYMYKMNHKGRLKFNLDVTSATDADLYVSRQPYPSQANYEWKSTRFGLDYVIIEEADPGQYYVAVQGQSARPCSYIITASTEYEYLTDGEALIEFMRAGSFRIFRSTISEYAHHVLSAVTLINGKTELYACSNCTTLTRETATFKSLSWPGNALYIPATAHGFHPGPWTFGVYAVENADFFVSIQTREGRLQAGQPRRGASAPGTPIYYVFPFNSDVRQDYFINIKTFHASTCVNIFASQTEIHPNATHFKWRGKSDPRLESHSIILLNTSTIDWSSPELYIAVEACPAVAPVQQQQTLTVDYELFVGSRGEPTYITQDFADVYPVQQGNHFAMLSARASEALYVELSSCTDESIRSSAQLYVSSNTTAPFPTKETAEFIGKATTDYTIVVSSSDVKSNTKYYVSVDTSSMTSTSDFLFSLFSTTRAKDPRPVAGNGGKITLQYLNTRAQGRMYFDVYDVVFEAATPSSVGSPMSLQYDVVALPYDKKSPIIKPNIYVPCAIRFNRKMRYIGSYSANKTTNADTIRVKAEVPVLEDGFYLVNVIVRDLETGLEAVYSPVPVDALPTAYQWFSIGATLILIALMGFIAYLLIGTIYKFVRFRARGISAIPNIEFWQDLPLLVADGVKFVGSGFRVPKTYETFVDEQVDDEHAINRQENVDEEHNNPFKMERVEDSNRAGYGAI
jgi:hypothetical protein